MHRIMEWLAWLVAIYAFVVAAVALDLSGIVTWLVSLALMYALIVVHELGHALVAYKLGARVHKVAAGWVCYNVAYRRFTAEKTKHNGDIGGYVQYTPPRDWTSKKGAMVSFAGPAANFLAAAVCYIWIILGDQYSVLVTNVLPAIIALSLGIGVGNLLPYQDSDGMHIWHAWRRDSLR